MAAGDGGIVEADVGGAAATDPGPAGRKPDHGVVAAALVEGDVVAGAIQLRAGLQQPFGGRRPGRDRLRIEPWAIEQRRAAKPLAVAVRAARQRLERGDREGEAARDAEQGARAHLGDALTGLMDFR